MTQEPEDFSPLRAAYLQAEAMKVAGKPKPERKKTDKGPVLVPNLRIDARTQFRRENSAEVADQLAAQIEAEREAIVVRKPTIHVEPIIVRAEIEAEVRAEILARMAQEEQKRTLLGKLRSQAMSSGRSLSGWINSERAGGWRFKEKDKDFLNGWADLMVNTGDQDLESRITVVESFADGMRLNLTDTNIITVPLRMDTNRNRVDYVQRITAQEPKADLFTTARAMQKGVTGKGLPVRGATTGGFLLVSCEHMSGYHGKPEQLGQFRNYMMDQRRAMEVEHQPFTAKIASGIWASWIGQDDVRAYFQRRHL